MEEGGGVECQLKASKSGVCLDQHWMFRDRGEEGSEGPKFRCHKFFFLFVFVFLCLFTLCSFIVFFIVLHVKQKR